MTHFNRYRRSFAALQLTAAAISPDRSSTSSFHLTSGCVGDYTSTPTSVTFTATHALLESPVTVLVFFA